ncbi:hypothetical protein OHU11_10775 [Streptomyces sp. NBC_00257]|uniref:hypothetical protein n=1 Tax=unclassified Streptomyces TaxID=2593676 RepID=UPI00224F37B4|nr:MULTISPECIES: hypothetical protein [unclassified Streptomyces]WTB57560.1 hypothetical protein OG832_32555 [Streptomyces sp. NBC_00826]WTH89558.1 hypothetical protein OIC43_11140 [Streptomyces sp. NBC_00825]WTH98285.1 hypothetical protein OHA23_11125 [Streptomyces sp. NBC_00822]MCX4863642.1 hypothetical protein [Streptomyces sp. NBC_00906]MCX4894880.1 hypothetical protein [Streptomyces sp. NBC_00892]
MSSLPGRHQRPQVLGALPHTLEERLLVGLQLGDQLLVERPRVGTDLVRAGGAPAPACP